MTQPPPDSLVLGTRGSNLALAQSHMVRRALEEAHHGLRITQKIITTTGDARTKLALHEPTAEGAGFFTRQLEQELLAGGIDLAVHSLKDLPVETPPGLVLAAILPRAPVADILLSRQPGGLEKLRRGAVVGTSSPRRALLLRSRRPDLDLQPIRGNVPTRLEKLASGGSCEATLLAEAGLRRLGHDVSAGVIGVNGVQLWMESLDWMLPAPGQGAIAVETRIDDRMVALLAPLHDAVTARCVAAERLVLKYLGGGCHLALGALATESDGIMDLKAVYVPDEKALPREALASGRLPEELARDVADQLLAS